MHAYLVQDRETDVSVAVNVRVDGRLEVVIFHQISFKQNKHKHKHFYSLLYLEVHGCLQIDCYFIYFIYNCLLCFTLSGGGGQKSFCLYL